MSEYILKNALDSKTTISESSFIIPLAQQPNQESDMLRVQKSDTYTCIEVSHTKICHCYYRPKDLQRKSGNTGIIAACTTFILYNLHALQGTVLPIQYSQVFVLYFHTATIMLA